MTNNDKALYFVFEILSYDSEGCDTAAIRLVHGTELPLPWTAWVMNDHPFNVGFGFYLDMPYDIHYSSHFDSLRQLIQTTKLLVLDGSAASTTVPFYLASDMNRSPTNYEVTVQLLFDTMDFLPQVQAHIAYRMQEKSKKAEIDSHKGRLHRFLERLIYRERRIEEIELTTERDLEIRVQSQKLFPGLYMPVSVADVEVPGVLLLKEALGERIFRATLYASDTLEKIQMPVTLVSTGMWWERHEHHDEQHIITKVIGRIVEMM